MNDMNLPGSVDTNAILSRIHRLERQNRHLKIAGGGFVALIVLAAALGLAPRGAGDKIAADELTAGVMRANSIIVQTDKGTVRIDKEGITLTAPGLPGGNRNKLIEHEARIEIGMDYQWTQDNGLTPTPRIAVGRAGRDTSKNLVTRAAVLSPEGVHSGEWHTNNPRHDGKTDRDLIEDLKKK